MKSFRYPQGQTGQHLTDPTPDCDSTLSFCDQYFNHSCFPNRSTCCSAPRSPTAPQLLPNRSPTAPQVVQPLDVSAAHATVEADRAVILGQMEKEVGFDQVS